MRKSRLARAALAVAFLAGLVLLWRTLPLARWALALLERAQQAGAAGVLLFAAAYVAAPVLLLPGSILSLGAGFLYGRWYGSLLVLVCATAAALISFALGRTLARGWVRGKIAKDERLGRIDRAMGERAFRLVFLLRLSPVVPFSLLNYALGATAVSPRAYAGATAIGMIPGIFLYCSLGATAGSLAHVGAGARPPPLAFWFGIAATLVSVVFLTALARRALAGALPAERAS